MTTKPGPSTYKERIESRSQHFSRLFAKSFTERFAVTPNPTLLLENEILMLEYLTEGKRMSQWENFRANLHVFSTIQKKLPAVIKKLTPEHIKQLYSNIVINRITTDYIVLDETGQVPQNNEDVVSFIFSVSAYRSMLMDVVKEQEDRAISERKGETQQLALKSQKITQGLLNSRIKPQSNSDDPPVTLRIVALIIAYAEDSGEYKDDLIWDDIALEYGFNSKTSGHNIYAYHNYYQYKENRLKINENRRSDHDHLERLRKTILQLDKYPKAKLMAEKEFESFELQYLLQYVAKE